MKTYYYSARDKAGSLVKGEIEAQNLADAKAKIFKLALVPIQVSENYPSSAGRVISRLLESRSNKVSIEDMLVFNRQFQMVYASGIALVRGLFLIQQQTENPYFKKVLKSIITHIGNGETIGAAFAKYPKVFDSTYVNLLMAGEASGQLDQILERISTLHEQKAETREQVRSALLYPKIVVVVLSLVFLVIVYFVIPKFEIFFAQFGAQLPLLTRALLGFSELMMSFWWLILIVSIAVVTSFKKLVATEQGQLKWHQFQLRIPLLGSFLRQTETGTFCAVLGLLSSSGLPVIESLRLTKESLTNDIFKLEVDRISHEVEQGGGLAKPLLESSVFPDLVGGLISVGEESGSLDSILAKIASFYALKVKHRIANLSKVIEPALLIIIFGAVLILALGIFMPMWTMSGLVRSTR